jgi:hypothetical protein
MGLHFGEVEPAVCDPHTFVNETKFLMESTADQLVSPVIAYNCSPPVASCIEQS